MSKFGQTYDVTDLPEGSAGEPVPAGTYLARITEAEIKETKNGTGSYIKLRWDIAGPTHEGRVVFDNINIKNDSQKAEEIGLSQLRSLLVALGLARVSDTDELLNGVAQIKVAIGKAQEGYEPSNEVRTYKAAEGSVPPTPATGSRFGGGTAKGPKAAAVVAPAAVDSKTPPWKR